MQKTRGPSGLASALLAKPGRPRLPDETASKATATHHYDIRFLIRSPQGAKEQISDESQALGWFTPDALPDPLAEGVRTQISAALTRFSS